ncbi:MAG: thrombospondin type 3 repeat-containing protein [Nanoarchaeota archaeon]|nr:thrombospondin type 3 repeat-containing protein [Nanoarchaeota archaeon]
MKKFLLTLLIISVFVSSVSAASMTFYESFENQQSLEDNGCIDCSPSSFDTGIVGNAAFFGRRSSLTYSIQDNINKNEGTASFWVKPDKIQFQGGYFDYGGLGYARALGVFKSRENKIFFELRSDQNDVYQQGRYDLLKDDDWVNVVVTWKANTWGSIMGLYVNGNPIAVWYPIDLDFNPTENYFTVGSTGYWGVANAYIDELKIYDYAKPDAEIRGDYYNFIGYVPPQVPAVKPASQGPVKIINTTLYVDNQEFPIKGAGYQPTPICERYGYDFFSEPEIYNRDFALLRDMNANTIRTWAKVTNSTFLDAAYNNGNQSIYVIMGFYIPNTYEDPNIDYSDPATIESIKNEFSDYVTQFKDNPSVLMWALGNENNMHYDGNIAEWYYLANELAKVAYEVEGNNYHPVTIINGDIGYIGDAASNADDATLTHVDAWAANTYKGYSFGSYFDEYASYTSRPLWISEYGIDALDNTINQEYQQTQADWAVNLWQEIADSNIVLGGTLMEYSDEWVKDWETDDPCVHTTNCAYETIMHPDGCSNEEWYGIMWIEEDPYDGVNLMHPRQVYYALQSEFADTQDSDGDGVPDSLDNCPSIPNPNQEDIDNDGLGDACDSCTDVDQDTYCAEIDDCNDNDDLVNPGAAEICNNVDDNCNQEIDENLTRITGTNEGECSEGFEECQTGEWITIMPEVGPTNETCDGLDNDCDGIIDQITRQCGLTDIGACEYGAETCDNATWGICIGAVYPTNETCNGLDDDCDGSLPSDEEDIDLDNYMVCENDCDDNNASINPGAQDPCNDGIDQDCSGADTVCNCLDNDVDTYYLYDFIYCPYGNDCNDNNASINPGAAEICNGVDDNCNDEIDEGDVCGSPVQCWSASYQYLTKDNNQAKKFCKCASGVYGYLDYGDSKGLKTSYSYIDTEDNENWETAGSSSPNPIDEVQCTDGLLYYTNQDHFY